MGVQKDISDERPTTVDEGAQTFCDYKDMERLARHSVVLFWKRDDIWPGTYERDLADMEEEEYSLAVLDEILQNKLCPLLIERAKWSERADHQAPP